ncbi:MAG: hypothetical protein Q8L11_00355 [Candidatus Moranbacteria bacterium]|nr:hypothetical protein [Candidatus Moranbacteria bacterium]
MAERQILLGLTTTLGSDWRMKAEEIDRLGIKELALFLTCLGSEDRRELYGLLENTSLESIPHVHLRDDMELWELDYLVEKYHTQVFNIHPKKSHYPLVNDLSKYNKRIYIENTPDELPAFDELESYGGVCLDTSHWENWILEGSPACKRKSDGIKKILNLFPAGCAHISAISAGLHDDPDKKYPDRKEYSSHWLDNLSEVDYVKKYRVYLPKIVSIELENPLEEQLEIKKYLDRIIN